MKDKMKMGPTGATWTWAGACVGDGIIPNMKGLITLE